jgi:membrane protease subunit HflC
MKNIKVTLIVVFIIVIVFFIMGPYFILEEGEQAVVVRFGKIIRADTEAGLKFKLPVFDSVRRFSKRILSWDGDAQKLPTEENMFIWVDTTARWKIIDPKLFYESVGTIPQAHSRLDDVINSNVRKIIARNPLRESIRNSNMINAIERKNVFETQDAGLDQDQKAIEIISTFTKTEYPEINKGRTMLSDEMLAEALKKTPKYGIQLIDIIIRQIKYSDDLKPSVYNRMIKERNQIAQAFRSDGEGERAKWLGRMEKERLNISSAAERKAKEIKAKADAEALDIRNRAYNQNPEFADFWMAMQQYEALLPKMKKILTTDLEFFKYLYKKTGF